MELLGLLAFNVFLIALLFAMARGFVVFFGMGRPIEPVQAASPPNHRVVTGVVKSSIAKGVGSYFPGAVETLFVEKGQRVTRGQLLFRMDLATLEERINAAAQKLALATAEVRQAYRGRERALAGLRKQVAFAGAQLKSERQALAQARLAAQTVYATNTPGVFTAAYQPDFTYSETRIASMRSALASAKSRLQQLEREWHLVVVDAIQQKRAAAAELQRLKSLAGKAKRYSPIDGVVTSIRVAEGQWTPAKNVIVRVDDPAGYQVVSLVDRTERRPLEEGMRVDVFSGSEQAITAPALISKIIDGWDKEVFRYWVVVKPKATAELFPGERVRVLLPTQRLTARSEESTAETASSR